MTDTISNIRANIRTIAQTITAPAFDVLKQRMLLGIEKLEEPIQLAIIGKISSSKSTLVNAIIGNPYFAPTGQMEVTWNVSWIQPGNRNSDAEVVLKDGTRKNVSAQQWKRIAIGEGDLSDIGLSNNDVRGKISYIKLKDDSSILNSINIIDTPGLEAHRQLDSQNTIDFLTGVCRPDAILTLFVHNPTQSVMNVVEDFVGAGGTLTPLNSIGVMAKFDLQWNVSYWGKNMLVEMRNMAQRQFDRFPAIKNNLFRLYPVSALMFLASQTLTDTQFKDLQILAGLEENVLRRTLPFSNTFIESPHLPLASSTRKELLENIGAYGIYIIIRTLKDKPSADLMSIKTILRKESGADDLMEAIYNHFGTRAALLKAQSLYQSLVAECNKYIINKETGMQAYGIKLMLDNAFRDVIYEVREYSLLTSIYDNSVQYLSSEEILEFCSLCGENGSDAHSRLAVPLQMTPEQMQEHAHKQACKCRRKAQILGNTARRDAMLLMQESYLRLAEQIGRQYHQYKTSYHYLYNQKL